MPGETSNPNKSKNSTNSKKKFKTTVKTSKSTDSSSSLSNDQEISSIRKTIRNQSRLVLADGAFDVSQLTRDLWLDNRQSVQNGTRCILCDVNNVRYMCTSRSLRDWEENKSIEIIAHFKEVFHAQRDLALSTPFVQPVIAARTHRWDLLVISPLPSNMYLCDFKKLAVHLSHSTVRYYAACILLGLEFMQHQRISHGNLSLASIALDLHGRPQITDFDTLLNEKIKEVKELPHQLDSLRYAALLGVLHCDNIRHFSIAHMHSKASDSRHRNIFMGICPKCRITAECMDPKNCDCSNFGALIRFIRSKIFTKDAQRQIFDKLQPAWIEADMCYTWSPIPKAEEKLFDMELMRSASQIMYSSGRFSSYFVDNFDEFDSNDSDASGQARNSGVSIGFASSLAALTAGGTSVTTGSKKAIAGAIEEAKRERQCHRRQELQRSRLGSSINFGHLKSHLLGWSSDSLTKSVRDSTWQRKSSAPGTGLQGANNENGTQKSTFLSESGSGSSLELVPREHSKSPALPTHPVPKPRLRMRALPGQMQMWRMDSNDEGPSTMPLSGGQAAEHKIATPRSGHNQGSVIPQTNYSSSAAGKGQNQENKDNSTAFAGFNKPINNDLQLSNNDDGQHEFAFNGYQQMMQHKYFMGTNWAALEAAQPPEGFWFAHGLIMQNYSREQAAAVPNYNRDIANNDGIGGDESDRLTGSYFTSRSRILYSLFG